MRVLVVSTWFPSASAPGAGIFNLRDAEMLATEHDVKVLHLVDAAGEEIEQGQEQVLTPNLRVQRVPFDIRSLASVDEVAQRIRKEAAEADLVHTMAFHAVVAVAKARVSVPWVHTEHWSRLAGGRVSLKARMGARVLPFSKRLALGGAALFSLLQKPQVVVAVGEGLARSIERFRKDECVVISNAVRVPEGVRLPDVPESRQGGPLRIVAVGNLIEGKGPMQAVDAVAKLREFGIEAELQWAGVGVLEQAVLEHAEALGVADRVRLLGHVDSELLPELLIGAHVFLLPTAGETFGVALAEALMCGLPVVTSGVGGHLAFLPKQASRVVARRDGESLARAICELASDPKRWPAEMIQNDAKEKFSESSRREQYREVYDRALGMTNRVKK